MFWTIPDKMLGSVGSSNLKFRHTSRKVVKPDYSNLDYLRRNCLWTQFVGGGSGIEWYFGYQGDFGDVQSEDFRVVEKLWKQSKNAVDFMHQLPFTQMKPENSVVSNDKGLRTYAFIKSGSYYLLSPTVSTKGRQRSISKTNPGSIKFSG